jgi:hypothetical protein
MYIIVEFSKTWEDFSKIEGGVLKAKTFERRFMHETAIIMRCR